MIGRRVQEVRSLTPVFTKTGFLISIAEINDSFLKDLPVCEILYNISVLNAFGAAPNLPFLQEDPGGKVKNEQSLNYCKKGIPPDTAQTGLPHN